MRDAVALLAVLIAFGFAGCAAIAHPHDTTPARAEISQPASR